MFGVSISSSILYGRHGGPRTEEAGTQTSPLVLSFHDGCRSSLLLAVRAGHFIAAGLVLFCAGNRGLLERWPASRVIGYLGRTFVQPVLGPFSCPCGRFDRGVRLDQTSVRDARIGLVIAYVASSGNCRPVLSRPSKRPRRVESPVLLILVAWDGIRHGKPEVAQIFDEVADRLELKGEIPFAFGPIAGPPLPSGTWPNHWPE